MEIVYFTVIAIGLYFVADGILDRVETARGARFEHRAVVFFAIILVLSMATFQVLGVLMKPVGS